MADLLLSTYTSGFMLVESIVMKFFAPISRVQSLAVHPLSERNALMQRVLDAALEFAPDRQYKAPGRAPSKAFINAYSDWLIEKLLHELQVSFWRDLYVHRPILSDVLQTKSKARVTVLAGLPGVGKTITALKIVQLLYESYENARDTSNQVCCLPVYIDLKKYANSFHSLESVAKRDPSKIYQLLSLCIGLEITPLIYDDALRLRLQEASREFPFNLGIRESMSEIVSSVLRELAKDSGLYIVLDSVDNLSPTQQQISLDYLFGLSNNLRVPCLLPIRTANLQRFSTTAWRTDFMDLVEFDAEDEEGEDSSDQELFGKRGKLNYVHTRLNTTTFATPDFSIIVSRERSSHILRDILEKRLQKVSGFAELEEFLESLVGSGDRMSSMSYLRTFSKMANSVIIELVRSNGLYEAVNRSIRDSLIVVNGIVSWALAGSQPGFTVDSYANAQVVRSMYYRYLTTARDVHKARDLPEMGRLRRQNYWEVPLRNALRIESRALYALHLRILELLKHLGATEGKGISVKAVYRHFGLFGYGSEQVDEALSDLALPTVESALGLIWVRQVRDRDDEICVLPAGRFYFERLAVSLGSC